METVDPADLIARYRERLTLATEQLLMHESVVGVQRFALNESAATIETLQARVAELEAQLAGAVPDGD